MGGGGAVGGVFDGHFVGLDAVEEVAEGEVGGHALSVVGWGIWGFGRWEARGGEVEEEDGTHVF